MSTRPGRKARTITLWVTGSLLAAAAAGGVVLAFTDDEPDSGPAPVVTSTPEPTAPAGADPTPEVEATEPAVGPWKPAPIQDGLVTPPGVTLLGPAQTITEGPVRGWYAAAEVAEGTDLDGVVDDLLFQLSELGTPGTFGSMDGGVAIAASGVVDGTGYMYEIQVLAPSGDEPAQVLFLAAQQEADQ